MPKRKRDADDIMSSPSFVVLHQDVVGDILEKLPVESLLRFKSVSKLWRMEIESQRFQKRHLRHQEKTRDPSLLVGFLIRFKDTKLTLRTLSLGATSVSLENHADYFVHSKCILGSRLTPSCDRLTCLYSETFVYVINPATRWYRELPEARVQALLRDTVTQNDFRPFPLPGFGKDNITGIYKLVWLYNSDCFDLEGQTNTCEVFSFDTNNTWRHDVIVSSPHPTLHLAAPAHAYGCLHWFIDAVTETQILSFDLHTETFTVLMAKLPLAHAPLHRITMCTLKDRLCLSEDKGDIQTIWSLNQGNMTWDKIYSINLRSTLRCIEEEFLLSVPPITSLSNNNLLLYDCCDDNSKLVLYNYRLNSFSFFTFSFRLAAEAISYSQSLITLP